MTVDRCPTCGGPVEVSVEGGKVVFRSSAGAVRFTEATRLTDADTTKTEGSQSFSVSAYAYVPDASKPSTWKLRLEEEPGKGPTAKQVGMALAALSPGGFRGRK